MLITWYWSFFYCTLILIYMVQEHEQALIDAIQRLGEISDGESGNFTSNSHCLYFSLICLQLISNFGSKLYIFFIYHCTITFKFWI